MAIRTATITFTVLFDDAVESARDIDLSDLASELNDGAMVGQRTSYCDELVDPTALKGELLAVGNDGTFFGD